MLVKDLMTPRLATVNQSTSASEASELMRRHSIGMVPVVESAQSLCGVLTDRDIVIRCISEKKDPTQCTAQEICTPKVESIDQNKTIDEALQQMSRQQIKRLVVTQQERPVGMLSLGDIARVRASTDTARALSEISMP